MDQTHGLLHHIHRAANENMEVIKLRTLCHPSLARAHWRLMLSVNELWWERQKSVKNTLPEWANSIFFLFLIFFFHNKTFCLLFSRFSRRHSLTYRVKSAHKVKLTDKQLLQWMVPILLVMLIYLGTWTLSATPSAEVVRLKIYLSCSRWLALAVTARIYFSRFFAFFYSRRDNINGGARVRANRLTVICPRKLRTVDNDTCSPIFLFALRPFPFETFRFQTLEIVIRLSSVSIHFPFSLYPFFVRR